MLPPVALSTISWIFLSCLMLISQVQGEDLVKDKSTGENVVQGYPAARITCPKGSVAYVSYCYALYTTPTAWMDAEISCQSRHSGHLTSVLSGSEASFVSSLIKTSSSRQTYVWIGLHDPTEGNYANAGGWMWISTDVMNYQVWEKRPPTSPNFGYCGSVTQSSGFRKWKDYDCDIKLPYVCKFKN